jgi:hypothetical protein
VVRFSRRERYAALRAILSPMTTMQPRTFGTLPGDEFGGEQRTSVMAILSLVLSLICFIPGFGLIGAILGVTALLVIGGSQGRLSGRGLAVGGIIMGLLFTMIWGGIGIGAMRLGNYFNTGALQPVSVTIKAIDDGDYATAKAQFASPTKEALTDAEIEAFRTAYKAELGGYKASPTGLWDFMAQMGAAGQMMNRFQGSQNLIPIPLTFEKGLGVLAVQVSQNGGGPGAINSLPFTNFELITPSGKSIILYDPNNRPLPSAPAAPTAPTAPTAPVTTPPVAPTGSGG